MRVNVRHAPRRLHPVSTCGVEWATMLHWFSRQMAMYNQHDSSQDFLGVCMAAHRNSKQSPERAASVEHVSVAE